MRWTALILLMTAPGWAQSVAGRVIEDSSGEPLASVPTRLLLTSLPEIPTPETRMPFSPSPEITLPALAVVPPIVFELAPSAIETPCPPFATVAVPAVFVPM